MKDQPYQRSEKQIENDKFLIFNIPFNRWILFPCAFLVQSSLGSINSWSVFNKPIDSYIYGDQNKGRVPNGMDAIFFLLAGPFLERNGPTKGIIVGGICLAIGHYLAAIAVNTKQILILYFGYSFFSAVGNAIIYLSPISTLIKWFPDNRGLASGVAVCSVSAGNILIAQAVLPMVHAFGLIYTFIVLGSVFRGVLLALSLVYRLPPPCDKEKAPEVIDSIDIKSSGSELKTVKSETLQNEEIVLKEPNPSNVSFFQALFSNEFRMILIIFVANEMSEHIFNSHLSNMVQDIYGKNPKTATMVVTINAAFNLFGRCFIGFLSERIGRKRTFNLLLSLSLVCFLTMTHFINNGNYNGFIAFTWIYSISYGGGFGTLPAFLSEIFRNKNIAPTHGVCMATWNLSGLIGGFVFTGIYDSLRDKGHSISDPILYNTNLYWLSAIVAFGLVVSFLIPVTVRDRKYPAVPKQILKKRLFGRIIRVIKRKRNPIEIVSKEKENEEWNNYFIQHNETLNVSIKAK
ncbi:hypothetical protein PPL_04403 [Heterostelium album PN500]|uniref:Major facilitator superfamily (MFS) profile domain-containing protein n=1 Tax=Heterostelium pallidum (strain ATCC 26659 / Pp 5 / PN500) TaxID=670386 RepID=D3B7G5_HETP5|nr:hypothetical protein PPL_04403 [Heterostelium album PN500]EFA82708.1 hypothetical protein PPL_04403 [Heterostelium album PN500]|eukprot:XP_020434825.1 hypothetical protein PPL_04403 [Heterostelium album PN500]